MALDTLGQAGGAAAVEAGPTADRAAWLAWRRQGIGSSDAAAIAGLDPFHGPISVWLDKTGRLADRDEESEYVRWGRLLEPAIALEFETRTGLFVRLQQALVTDAERPWMRATVDGVVYDLPPGLQAENDTPLGLIEIKTVAGFKSDAWTEKPENPLGIPEHFQVQVMHQLAVTGLERAWIAVLFGGQRLELRELERNEETVASLIEMEAAFWQRCVVEGNPPGGDGTEGSSQDLRDAYATAGAGSIDLERTAEQVILERQQAKVDVKEAERRCAAADQALMAMLGDAEIGLIAGRQRVTWKRFERRDVDLKALTVKHKSLVEEFARKTPYRVLRVVGDADEGES